MFKFNKRTSLNIQKEILSDTGNEDSEHIEYVVHTLPIENPENLCLSLLTITSSGHVKILNGITEPHVHKTTYRHILTPLETKQIRSTNYVREISTFFIQLERQVLLLNTGNLTKYDKINEKNGYKTNIYSLQLKHTDQSALVYGCAPTTKDRQSILFKCFLWDTNSGDYKHFISTTLQLKSYNEQIQDIQIMTLDNTEQIIILTTDQVFVWDISSKDKSSLQLITNYMAKKWFDIQQVVETSKEEPSLRHANSSMSLSQKISNARSQTSSTVLVDNSSALSVSSNKQLKNKKSWFQLSKNTANSHVLTKTGTFLKLIHLNDNKLYVSTSLGQIYQIICKNQKYYMVLINQYNQFPVTLSTIIQMKSFLIDYEILASHLQSKVLRVFDPFYGYIYGELDVQDESIQNIYPTKDYAIIVQLTDSIEVYDIAIDDHMDKDLSVDSILAYQKRMVFWDSVTNSDGTHMNTTQLLKLRDISCMWAVEVFKKVVISSSSSSSSDQSVFDESFQNYCIAKVFNIFLSFLAPPHLVVPLIEYVPVELCRQLVIPYFIEIERFCKNLNEANTDKCVWRNGVQVDLNFFIVAGDEKTKNSQELLQLVDTTLLTLYLNYNEALLKPFLRVPNQCDVELVVEQLIAKQRFQDLIEFYHFRKLHERALLFLINLDKYVPTLPLDSIMMLVFNYICQLDNEYLQTIIKYLHWLFDQNWNERTPVEMCKLIFFQPRIEFDTIKVYDFLKTIDPHFACQYLEYCTEFLGNKKTQIYSELIIYYLENIPTKTETKEHVDYLGKIYALIKNKPYYDYFELLSLLDDKLNTDKNILTNTQTFVLTHCKSLALKHMNDHEAALKIIIDELHSYPLAAEYIESVHESGNDENFNMALKILFKILSKKGSYKKLILLLHQFGSFYESKYILENLPGDIPIQEIQPILFQNIILQTKITLHDVVLKKSLVQVSLIDHDFKALQSKSTSFAIEENSKCFACGKLLSPGLIPNGIYYGYKIHGRHILVHYNCKSVISKKLTERHSIKHLTTLGELNRN